MDAALLLKIIAWAVIIGFAPGCFYMVYFYRKDWQEPEPKKLVVLAFFLGILGIVPALILEWLIPAEGFLLYVVEAPIVEELVKFFVVLLVFYPMKQFNEPMDGIVYVTAVSLGFASIENTLYVINSNNIWHTVFFRALLSVPGHALYSLPAGAALGMRKCINLPARNWLVAGGLLVSIAGHSIFNFLARLGVAGPVLLFVFVYLLWKYAGWKMHRAEMLSPFRNKPFKKKPRVKQAAKV